MPIMHRPKGGVRLLTVHHPLANMTATKVTSYAAGLNTPDLQKLREKHSEILNLLNTVDRLRDNNLGKYVELPQIVVVGDQSSGKSSVLSAISRVQFPSRGNICTRFATELSLRDAKEPRLEARIRPHEGEERDVKEHLGKFHKIQSKFDTLPKLIEAASDYMRIAKGGNYYSKSVLSIKISGPEIPNLTLVDLPGFYALGSDDQPIEFSHVVEQLAMEYMENNNSIILGVVAASHSITNQTILEKIKPYTGRSLGIVTKPDRLDKGGDSQATFLGILHNEGPHKMGYGWHVVRNPGEGEVLDFTARDQQESEYLSTPPWIDIPEHKKGIESLRKKLCDVLLAHVAWKLPEVAIRINDLSREYDRDLSNLPKERSNPEQCQQYLLQLSEKFVQLARQVTGVSGKDPGFFGTGSEDPKLAETMSSRNLRGRVRDMNQDFITVMGLYGAKYFVQWRDHEDTPAWIQSAVKRESRDLKERYNVSTPKFIHEDEFEARVDYLSKLRRGNELPGITDPRLALEIFHDQSRPWGSIASRHVELVVEKAQSVVEEILEHITEHDVATRQRIQDKFIEPFFEEQLEALLDKVKKLLPLQHESCYPAPLETFFEMDVMKRVSGRVQRMWAGVKKNQNMDDTQLPPEADNIRLISSTVNAVTGSPVEWSNGTTIDYAVQYYDVSLNSAYAAELL